MPSKRAKRRWRHKSPGHYRSYCALCQEVIVICGHCGNNCCNAGYGLDGECPHCPGAYRMWDNRRYFELLPYVGPRPKAVRAQVDALEEHINALSATQLDRLESFINSIDVP